MDPIELERELTKLLVGSSLDFVRGTGEALQSVTGLLLTAYLAAIVAVAKVHGSLGVSAVVAALPVILFTASLCVLFGTAALYRGGNFVLGDFDSTLSAYESVLRSRRRQVVVPALLTIAGIATASLVALLLAD